ncbi:hypothetical protein L9F63_020418, partial [Diploptera punctata]
VILEIYITKFLKSTKICLPLFFTGNIDTKFNQSEVRRAELCIQVNGRHFQQLLDSFRFM